MTNQHCINIVSQQEEIHVTFSMTFMSAGYHLFSFQNPANIVLSVTKS